MSSALFASRGPRHPGANAFIQPFPRASSGVCPVLLVPATNSIPQSRLGALHRQTGWGMASAMARYRSSLSHTAPLPACGRWHHPKQPEHNGFALTVPQWGGPHAEIDPSAVLAESSCVQRGKHVTVDVRWTQSRTLRVRFPGRWGVDDRLTSDFDPTKTCVRADGLHRITRPWFVHGNKRPR